MRLCFPLVLDNTGESLVTHTKKERKTEAVYIKACFLMEQDSCIGKVMGPGSLACCLEGIPRPLALQQEVSGSILGSTDVHRNTMRLTSAHCEA